VIAEKGGDSIRFAEVNKTVCFEVPALYEVSYDMGRRTCLPADLYPSIVTNGLAGCGGGRRTITDLYPDCLTGWAFIPGRVYGTDLVIVFALCSDGLGELWIKSSGVSSKPAPKTFASPVVSEEWFTTWLPMIPLAHL
jgi:hypothetical protein